MITVDARTPSLDAIQAALRGTTEALAHELAHPTTNTPEWSTFEWLTARAVATIHGVAPLLSSRLRWNGPSDWEEFLRQQRAHTMNRHRRIEALLASIDLAARAEHIPVLALKGTALHAIGLYAVGERPMADVDLLVLPQDVERTARIIERLGFHKSFVYWKHVTFTQNAARAPAVLGEHSWNDMKLELHDRISEMLPVRLTDVTVHIFPRQPKHGLNAYPSVAALMMHLLLHAAGAMAYRSVRMIHLHDIALLAYRMTEGDWNEVLGLGGGGRGAWWALPPLALTARYYAVAIPPGVLGVLNLRCHWLLRRLAQRRTLSDVSLSYPWMEAFPGLAWAQSVGEMLEHVGKRSMRAASVLLGGLKPAAEETSPVPGASQQFSRNPYILRWLISRPARPETMQAVRAALAQRM
jgi:putative nucleotidyltransferase-like protein